MFSVGERVKLNRKTSGYKPGAEGVVITKPEPDMVQVDIDKSHDGEMITPPDPLLPLPDNYFISKSYA